MKPIAEFVTRLRAASSLPAASEAEVIRDVQVDAYQSGYAQAARDLFGIALESQDRTEAFLNNAQAAGVVSGAKLAS